MVDAPFRKEPSQTETKSAIDFHIRGAVCGSWCRRHCRRRCRQFANVNNLQYIMRHLRRNVGIIKMMR
jgi:hypothetical protein